MNLNFFSRCQVNPSASAGTLRWRLALLGAVWLALGVVSAIGPGLRAAETVANAVPQSYQVRGLVREIAADRRTALIRHETIPGYMPAMTMELNVRNTNELAGIVAGDSILFRLQVNDETHWIDQIHKVAGATNAVTLPATPPESSHFIVGDVELKPGDAMPEAEFLDEHGRTIRFSQFRGQALAFTFFFTRCPLPDFCPLMNKNFSAARRLLLADTNAPTNWSLLCISFDAEFDRPTVLAGFAFAYRGDDTNHWQFASASPATLRALAPRLDLTVARDGAGFSHNLRTVVLDPQGRIYRQFDGNRWTAEQLATAVREAASLLAK
jgi:protein SCO1